MLHADRIWSVSEVSSAEALAKDLTESTWCCCQAFRIAGHPQYVWLNDSTSEDGAQEYAVLKLGLAKGDMLQIESITFGWCDQSTAERLIRETLDGRDDNNEFARQVKTTIQSPSKHEGCQHCA